ncbi:MAG: winged helix-turn-helix transcriptional regulator [Candidatus Lokiarchaeota archaeon]|nr:winged helix-turn-helix transcriptional regulator [Candidatus Lokiarchaeota archaeon]
MNKKREKILIDTLEGCVDIENVDVKKYLKDLQDFGKNIKKKEFFADILNFCNVLGNQERLKIIQSLQKKDHCVCELEAILDKSQSTISHHLRELEKIGLIRGWKKGKFTHYDIIKGKMEYYLNILNEKLVTTK